LAQFEDMAVNGIKAYTVLFGGSLEYIVQLEKAQGSPLKVPMILKAMTDAVEKFGGFKTKGIFRIAAERTEIEALKSAIEEGKYEVKKADPHVPADVLKHWLRDLMEPLIPMSMYEECLKSSDNPGECLKVVRALPLVNYDALDFLFNWLCQLAKHQSVTAMSEENIAIVFCTDLLRTDEKDPAVLFKNSPKEKNFVRNLLLAWADRSKHERKG